MDSLIAWFHETSNFQLTALVGVGLGVWWIFAHDQLKLFAAALFCWTAVVGIAVFPPEGNVTGLRFLLMFAVAVAGYVFYQNAANYHELELEGIDDAYELEVAKNNLRIARERGKHIDREAAKKVRSLHQQLDTDLQMGEVQQEEIQSSRKQIELRNTLIEQGNRRGLTPEYVVDVNKAQVLSDMGVEEGWKKAVAALRAGDILETADIQVVKKLTDDLAEEVRKRQAVIDGDDHPDVKRMLVIAHMKNISHLEAKINARRTGLVLPQNGQEALGSGEEDTDLGRYSEPETERDKVTTPVKRPRGRPRKNPAE